MNDNSSSSDDEVIDGPPFEHEIHLDNNDFRQLFDNAMQQVLNNRRMMD